MSDGNLTYSDFLDVSEDYFPVVSPDSIKSDKLHWEDTYPHDTIVGLLKDTELMLGRAKAGDRRGIWIEGSYGTGKSRTMWMLDHLLSGPAADLVAYFNRHTPLQTEIDLRDKLLAHKQAPIITVSRYFSNGIESEGDLILAVFDGVTQALKDAGMDYKGDATLRGRICAWLQDEANATYFNLLTKKPAHRVKSSLQGKTAWQVASDLQSDANVTELVDQILQMGREEGIQPFKIGMDDLKSWVAEVTAINHLKAIVLLWDEFSTFFSNNRHALGPFQQLAEMSSDDKTPIYLIIATHMSTSFASPAEMKDKTASFRVVYDRFMHRKIEMPDDIAFRLIEDALKVRPNMSDEYDELKEELNDLLAKSRNAVRKATSTKDLVLQGIFPIHPMSALLLKHIATSFASNQRSMFNFIKNPDSEQLHAFQWFIRTHSPHDEDVLTIDYLWNFFYESGTDEHASGMGRSNLDRVIAGILDMYPATKSKLGSEDEDRVYKAILMMQAISRKLNNSVELLRPTEANLNLVFEGDASLDAGVANTVAMSLANKKLLHIERSRQGTEYIVAAQASDEAQIDDIQNRKRLETTTDRLLEESMIKTRYAFPASIRQRYDIEHVTPESFKKMANRLANEDHAPKIPVLICYAGSDAEQTRMRRLIDDAIDNSLYADLVFIDATATPLSAQDRDEYIKSASECEYWKQKDADLANTHAARATDVLKQWVTSVLASSFDIQGQKVPHVTANGHNGLNRTLERVAQQLYPLTLDSMSIAESFYTSPQFKNPALHALSGKYTPGESKVIAMTLGNADKDPTYWEEGRYSTVPETILAELKVGVDRLISDTLRERGRISIRAIIDSLFRQGFTPTPLYAAITGFLLRKYAESPYYYSIGSSGDTGGQMSEERLAEMIDRYFKYKKKPQASYKEEYLQLMTQNQRAFVDFASDMFGIPADQSVEQTAVAVRKHLQDLGCPLWAYAQGCEETLPPLVYKLAEALKGDGSAVSKNAEDLGSLLLDRPDAVPSLKQLLTRENGSNALRDVLNTYRDGALLEAAEEAGLSEVDLLAQARGVLATGDSSWLWNEETGQQELDKLLGRLQILAASHRLGVKGTTFSECIRDWKNYVLTVLRVPKPVLSEHLPELADFFSILHHIADRGDLTAQGERNRFQKELEKHEVLIRQLPDKMVSIVSDAYSDILRGLGEEDIEKLYAQASKGSFLEDRPAYRNKLESEASKRRRELRRLQLLDAWKKITGTKSPTDWSELNGTPIRAMIPASEESRAIEMLSMIDAPIAPEKSLRKALAYLKSSPPFLKSLSDKAQVEQAFSATVLGRFATVLTDNDEVRARLHDVLPQVPVADWSTNKAIHAEVEKLAEQAYKSTGRNRVLRKIDSMSSEDAKNWLKELVKGDLEIGVSILKQVDSPEGR